ncbi:tyrosine-type recombinase/integrase [Bradyrhizobium diazoefficiens]
MGNPYVLPGRKEGDSVKELKTTWRAIRRKAGLEEVRLHDMRHTFASIAAGAGASLYVIGKLLGHRNPATTQRYAHLANDPMRSVGQQVADSLAAALTPKAPEAR